MWCRHFDDKGDFHLHTISFEHLGEKYIENITSMGTDKKNSASGPKQKTKNRYIKNSRRK